MLLSEICKILEADFIGDVKSANQEISIGCGSDLMSDVLAFIKADALLLTGLVNPQVVRTADMAEVAAVCFVRGKRPQQDTIKLADEKKIPLLATELSMFESCGRLRTEGLPGCDEPK
jgi:predicted transcriptional regulator